MNKEDYTEIVSELNAELFDRFGEEINYFNYQTDGYVEVIYFNKEQLWCSEMEDREFEEELNDYTPKMEIHLRNKFNAYIDEINKLRL